ncbi:GNAT family N-acetyltransferase [Methanoculleus sp. FWC-SCC1]|uniref:GNAT family N-acetyltransferase n=1 Tax=Methanoculleus frigidifontis TaxID=2584085 RepID=A0ABT8MD98_9EURY|nr:GNAT family N-acetyltransferase [Methanoculleus sp. FWC-SCC1]MDN7025907.1 GNAT family N-acetyltransferase [Methanoculleus sp. FWC-SCC1]
MDLVPATVELLTCDRFDRQSLGITLNARIPTSWPPDEVTPEVLEEFIERLSEAIPRVETYYWVAREGETIPRKLVGNGGYLVHDDGTLEIGYSVAREHQGCGYATEAVRGLVARMLREYPGRRIIAHTYPHRAASIRVLEKNGFLLAGDGAEEGTKVYECALRSGRQP